MKHLFVYIILLLLLASCSTETYVGKVFGSNWTMDVKVEVLEPFYAPTDIDVEIVSATYVHEGVYLAEMIYNGKKYPVKVYIYNTDGALLPSRFDYCGRIK